MGHIATISKRGSDEANDACACRGCTEVSRATPELSNNRPTGRSAARCACFTTHAQHMHSSMLTKHVNNECQQQLAPAIFLLSLAKACLNCTGRVCENCISMLKLHVPGTLSTAMQGASMPD